MVEVVGTAPTSAMFITKFVYRHSWKTNVNNIKRFKLDSIFFSYEINHRTKKRNFGTTISKK